MCADYQFDFSGFKNKNPSKSSVATNKTAEGSTGNKRVSIEGKDKDTVIVFDAENPWQNIPNDYLSERGLARKTAEAKALQVSGGKGGGDVYSSKTSVNKGNGSKNQSQHSHKPNKVPTFAHYEVPVKEFRTVVDGYKFDKKLLNHLNKPDNGKPLDWEATFGVPKVPASAVPFSQEEEADAWFQE